MVGPILMRRPNPGVRNVVPQRPSVGPRCWHCLMCISVTNRRQSGSGEPSQLRFSFFYPQRPSLACEGHWLQFERVVTMDSAPEQEQATRIAQQFEIVDPKTHSRVVGGRRGSAEQLGYTSPDP